MDADAGMISTSSSAETSPSSSDVDTESTGSFFRDRSTTLGTLMGVSFADDAEEEEPRQREATRDGGEETEMPRAAAAEVVVEDGRRWRRRWRRRRRRSAGGGSWWRLCRDDVVVTTSLGQFLRMERQLSDAGLLCGDGGGREERESSTPLFDNERARRTLPAREERAKWQLRRSVHGVVVACEAVPVLLTAICSGGA
ncbi:hypothetical protein ABZP36_031946 [Zizania latifolia]